MPDPKHVHKFKRHRFKTGGEVYFCVLGCNVKIKPPFTLGKECICWRCGNRFLMNDYSIRLAKPHCMDCHKTKDEIQAAAKSDPKDDPLPVIIEIINPLQAQLDAATKNADEDI